MNQATMDTGMQTQNANNLELSKATKIGVLSGGISGEREVSLRSGKNVLAALERLGYTNAFAIDIKPDHGKEGVSPNSAAKSIAELAELKANGGIEFAFLVTHGTYGEDGCLQGALELMGIPYIGSKVTASASCMDKLFTKDILLANGLSTLPSWFESIPDDEALEEYFKNLKANQEDDEEEDDDEIEALDSEDESDDDEAEDEVESEDPGIGAEVESFDEEDEEDEEEDEPDFEEILKGPFILKPRSSGSSVGIVKLDNFSGFENDVQLSEKYPNCFAEPYIKGKEITASVIQLNEDFLNSGTPLANKVKALAEDPEASNCSFDGELLALPLLELRPKKEFYDYEAKYTEGMTEFILPAEIDEELAEEIQEAAIGAFEAMDCKGFARVDFMIAPDESEFAGPQILELNTLPGFTDTSDMPAQAKAAGISYDELVEMILLNQ